MLTCRREGLVCYTGWKRCSLSNFFAVLEHSNIYGWIKCIQMPFFSTHFCTYRVHKVFQRAVTGLQLSLGEPRPLKVKQELQENRSKATVACLCCNNSFTCHLAFCFISLYMLNQVNDSLLSLVSFLWKVEASKICPNPHGKGAFADLQM